MECDAVRRHSRLAPLQVLPLNQVSRHLLQVPCCQGERTGLGEEQGGPCLTEVCAGTGESVRAQRTDALQGTRILHVHILARLEQARHELQAYQVAHAVAASDSYVQLLMERIWQN